MVRSSRYGLIGRLSSKNTLVAADAHLIEAAYQSLLVDSQDGDVREHTATGTETDPEADLRGFRSDGTTNISGPELPDDRSVTPITKPVRRRNKRHLAFVAQQPCLICKRSPCDGHHLKFAQPYAVTTTTICIGMATRWRGGPM
jgi:hypothetical protein